MTESRAPLIFFAAGEASGDHYAAELYQRLHDRHPHLQAIGLGGAESRDAGIDTLVDMAEVSVMGLVEVLSHYRHLRQTLDQLIAALDERRPDLLIAIDFQEYNQRLARAARERGIPVLFFVAPQVWAWRPKRAEHFSEIADRLAVLFDFEVPLFERHGVPTTHVGHPLLDLIDGKNSAGQARAKLELPAAPAKVIGLLPGSRRGEIKRLLPTLLDTAQRLHRNHPDWHFVLPIARSLDADAIRGQILATVRSGLKQHLHIVDGEARTVMAACDALCITSGTATLEAALIGTPMVIIYRSNPLTYLLASRLVATPWIGLPNIIAGHDVVPELIQSGASPKAIAAEVESLLTDTKQADDQRTSFAEIRMRLGASQKGSALDRLAQLAEDMLPPDSVASGSQVNA